MANYGRNFEYLQPPQKEHRDGRFKNGSAVLLQGSPVVGTGSRDGLGRRVVRIATSADTPAIGKTGLLTYENPVTPFSGLDPVLASKSDLNTVPAGVAVQVVHGSEVIFKLHNTVDALFLNNREYEGLTIADMTSLVMDSGIGGGTGTAGDPAWAIASDAAHTFARVIDINTDPGWIVAQLVF